MDASQFRLLCSAAEEWAKEEIRIATDPQKRASMLDGLRRSRWRKMSD